MPQKIAEYLGLPHPELYTGHAFRRTAATLSAIAGATIMDLKAGGGWHSTKVAEEYVSSTDAGVQRRASTITLCVVSSGPVNKKPRVDATQTSVVHSPTSINITIAMSNTTNCNPVIYNPCNNQTE